MKKKHIGLALAALALLALAACGGAGESAESAAPDGSGAAASVLSYSAGGAIDLSAGAAEITAGGTYTLSGTLADGQVVVDAKGEDVTLVLDGADISCSHSAAIYVVKAENVTVELAAGSENRLAVTGDYVQTDDNNVDAAIFSKGDLVLTGEGSLTIETLYGHGVVSKDTLTVSGGRYTLDTAGHGIDGKDSLTVTGGDFAITCGTDALRASNDEDESLGGLTVTGGSFVIDCGDDAVHAEAALVIEGGSFDIRACYEGLEGRSVEVYGGSFSIVASDDAVNAATSATGELDWFNMMAAEDDCWITIAGGDFYIDAGGDGLDSNGALTVTGGTILLDGPTSGADGALDYAGEAAVTGGVVVATGSGQMEQNFGAVSTQGSILYTLGGTKQAGTAIRLTDEAGDVLVEYTPQKSFGSVLVSCPGIVDGGTYTLVVGEESYTVEMDGLIYGSGAFGGFGGGGRGGMGAMGGIPQGDRGSFGGGTDMTPPEGFDGATPPADGAFTPPEGGAEGAFTPPDGAGGALPSATPSP